MEQRNRERIFEGINVMTQFLEEWESKKKTKDFFFSYQDLFSRVFFLNGNLDEIFVELFPPEKLETFTKTLSLIVEGKTRIDNYSTIRTGKVRTTIEDYKNNITEIRDVLSNHYEALDKKEVQTNEETKPQKIPFYKRLDKKTYKFLALIVVIIAAIITASATIIAALITNSNEEKPASTPTSITASDNSAYVPLSPHPPSFELPASETVTQSATENGDESTHYNVTIEVEERTTYIDEYLDFSISPTKFWKYSYWVDIRFTYPDGRQSSGTWSTGHHWDVRKNSDTYRVTFMSADFEENVCVFNIRMID